MRQYGDPDHGSDATLGTATNRCFREGLQHPAAFSRLWQQVGDGSNEQLSLPSSRFAGATSHCRARRGRSEALYQRPTIRLGLGIATRWLARLTAEWIAGFGFLSRARIPPTPFCTYEGEPCGCRKKTCLIVQQLQFFSEDPAENEEREKII
jgi:hypothetical protein